MLLYIVHHIAGVVGAGVNVHSVIPGGALTLGGILPAVGLVRT